MWYLATPYRAYPGGLDAAYVAACEQAAVLMRAGIITFSPVSHTHGIAEFGAIEHRDDEFWMRQDLAVLDRCEGLIVCKLEGWKISEGVSKEMARAAESRKMIVFMEPGEVDAELLATVKQ
jgi:nucleoside 2-deoxyribosyltransferase